MVVISMYRPNGLLKWMFINIIFALNLQLLQLSLDFYENPKHKHTHTKYIYSEF
jgi:hypothetical protein